MGQEGSSRERLPLRVSVCVSGSPARSPPRSKSWQGSSSQMEWITGWSGQSLAASPGLSAATPRDLGATCRDLGASSRRLILLVVLTQAAAVARGARVAQRPLLQERQLPEHQIEEQWDYPAEIRNTLSGTYHRYYDNNIKDKSPPGGASVAGVWGKLYQWGAWGEASTCTRTCGKGVRYRKRYCYKSSTESRHLTAKPLCGDDDRRHELCNTQMCSGREDDFVAKQCSVYDSKSYKGKYHHWKPYIPGAARMDNFGACALVCTAEEQRFQLVVKFANKAEDGTPCHVNNTRGVCILGQCVAVGCDMSLQSSLVEDRCGICGGDNTSCQPVSGYINKNLSMGYNSLLTVPEAARHLRVVDVGGSAAVFALRNDRGIYFVDGMHTNRQPTAYENVAATTFFYHHPLYSKDGQEKIEAAGPTNETSYVMMLSAEKRMAVTVHYQYTIPYTHNNSSSVLLSEYSVIPPTTTTTEPQPRKAAHEKRATTTQPRPREAAHEKRWEAWERRWATESARPQQLNQPFERRQMRMTTAMRSDNTISTNLSSSTIYASKTTYNTGRGRPYWNSPVTVKHYEYTWRTSGVTPCSATCTAGIQSTYTKCYRSDSEVVDDKLCDAISRPEPTNQACKGQPCQPRWMGSAWSKCSVTCGEGQQHRNARCWRMMAPGFDSTVHDNLCSGQSRPPLVKPCQEARCGPMWETSEWAECSSKCGPGIQVRNVRCSSKHRRCDRDSKPASSTSCHMGPCTNKWVASDWSKCSGACGSGMMERTVECVSPSGQRLKDEFCDLRKRSLSIQACGDTDCPLAWVPQDWGLCSVGCGVGITTRRLVCGEIVDGEFYVRPNSFCVYLKKPPTTGRCRQKTCNAKWYTTDWSECSKTCGDGGQRIRKAKCYFKQRPSRNCNKNSKPSTSENCNLPPCENSSEPKCPDDGRTNCELVIQANLCGHWYYKTACCQSCRHINTNSAHSTRSVTRGK